MFIDDFIFLPNFLQKVWMLVNRIGDWHNSEHHLSAIDFFLFISNSLIPKLLKIFDFLELHFSI